MRVAFDLSACLKQRVSSDVGTVSEAAETSICRRDAPPRLGLCGQTSSSSDASRASEDCIVRVLPAPNDGLV